MWGFGEKDTQGPRKQCKGFWGRRGKVWGVCTAKPQMTPIPKPMLSPKSIWPEFRAKGWRREGHAFREDVLKALMRRQHLDKDLEQRKMAAMQILGGKGTF